jgi:hypothetical protein
MQRRGYQGDNRAFYLVVTDVRSDGPILGKYGEHKIAATVADYFGRRYGYVGIAVRQPSGRYDADALKPGEWIVEPGLVYKLENADPPKPSRRLARDGSYLANALLFFLNRLLG